ncbi:hypothetical protein HQ489_01885 [Candidatus Woesearchaeota archaeon]|nr:hypothetical protein [Candidatus Woesearchaeota archaeon]
MALRTSLPFGKKEGVKDLVFTILIKEYPLKIIQLTNFIKKRYGKSVTFQAVRKAVLELTSEGVLTKREDKFLVNKKWVLEIKTMMDDLFVNLNKNLTTPKDIHSVSEGVSVFTFHSLNELMKFWQDLIDDWYAHSKRGDYKINCYQAAHAWEGLLHLDREKELMGQLKKKGIQSYIISTGNTSLDKNIKIFYKNIGLKMAINPSISSFDKSYYVGTYGDLIIQTQYPEEIVKNLDHFFRKNKSLEDFDLKELSDIVNKKVEIKLTVIKNLAMAKQINKSIIDQM